ncbi:4Fe-4S dicluster domain-containing protein [Fontivita pretiosa]|uniref:4Fe-4S dicluster domain-containing protein n=1 Tax=Fontivita pretiosa TaxID=2989684 RepID=UPI003D182677
MSAEKPTANRAVNRRGFFRQGLRELLRPLVEAVEPVEQAIGEFSRAMGAVAAWQGSPPQAPPRWLRPPGAIAEHAFIDTCSRCGNCVRACPAQCIRIDPTAAAGNGAPYIDPEVMPCVVCDGLVCMRDCPSGALVPTALGLIDMGTAIFNSHTCVRSRGQDCTICIDRCPLGTSAIELRGGTVHVIEQGCIGCGVCQHACPTTPKSIVVVPRSALLG